MDISFLIFYDFVFLVNTRKLKYEFSVDKYKYFIILLLYLSMCYTIFTDLEYIEIEINFIC